MTAANLAADKEPSITAHPIRALSIADKATVKAVIQYLPAANDYTVFIVEGESAGRSLAQNALYWGWMDDFVKTDINNLAGHDKDHWHFEFKSQFLSRIYERDRLDYAQTTRMIRKVYREGLCEDALELRRLVVRLTSTKDATVKQFSEYLTEIERFAASQGVRLRTDSRLYSRAMGAK